MATTRTVDFLPEIFQTPVNQQFLAATLDQLVQEPKFKKSQGFVGRRIGPGVNPQDGYVIEPTAVRNQYQLEPGVCQINPDNSHTVVDIITYPGINDALALQGAVTADPSALYTSDYYTWDPFVDFDKFVNYAQYYWLPLGPAAVVVEATGIPLHATYTVTRNNGYYTFSGERGNNPPLRLARNGVYNFNVAQNAQASIQYRVTNNGTTNWVIDFASNPTLTLTRGNTYTFNLTQSLPLSFYIKTELSFGTSNLYNSGVTRNGASTGLITFTVPQDAPDTLYYCSPTEFNLRGQFDIVNGTPGTGPGFYIQTTPGVNGRIPATPNISSRDVYGVVNNGEDLGTVTFNTPAVNAQSNFYNMPTIGSIPNQPAGTVDLISELEFNQIDGVLVSTFFETNPTGIDGITNLDGRTVVIIQPTVQNSVWLISYVPDGSGNLYISLSNILAMSVLTKFNVQFGVQYASTTWYTQVDLDVVIMPLLTSAIDLLYYQDGQDPNMFGTIQLVDTTALAVLDITDILGRTQYTSPNGITFTNGLKVQFQGTTIPASYENNSYYVEGVGTAIRLLLVDDFYTPEKYTDNIPVPFDTLPFDQGVNTRFDGVLQAPLVPDYLTINRAGLDKNAWSRSNRWFHTDVITLTAEYNGTVPVYNQAARARRPVLEFRPNIRLINSGTESIGAVDIIDFTQTDALSTVNGSIGFTPDGYTLIAGSIVVFAADLDLEVRNKVYMVEFITPDTVPPLIAEPIINLIELYTAVSDQCIVSTYGFTWQGISFYFDGLNWIQAQEKTSVNQPPQFDIYDANGISFSNLDVYPSSNFTGSSLFSYAVGNGTADLVLGFPLTYLNLTNIGDIVFDNNFYSNSFNYTIDSVGFTTALSTGFVRQYTSRLTYQRELGWQDAVTPSQIRQQFRFVYDGTPLRLDIAVNNNTTVPAVQLFINANFIEPYDLATGTDNYTYTTTSNTTTITLQRVQVPGDLIEVQVLSDQISATGFYQVPINLENNPLNGNSNLFTLGTIRNHYSTIAQNLINLEGPVIGANNTRDLGNIIPYGLQILQQSAPLTLAGYFLRSEQYNIFNAIEFNSREYIKFKSLLLNTSITNDFVNMTVPQIVDESIAIINAGDTSISPFYWSDMLPTGSVVISNSTTVNPITTARFNTVQTYDFTTSNYLGLLVYVNDVILTRGIEYLVGIDTPTLTILIDLAVGDVVTINEYSATYGNFVPNTPTKVGLYPKFLPRMYLDTNYVTPAMVIQGHDGSITVAFGDIRDQVLLEFETRIYNNLKNDLNPVPLTIDEVLPGFFRTTDYTEAQLTQILGQDFLTWVGYNKLDYTTQDFLANNPFTFNYSTAGNRINGAVLDQGAWRGIYRYFYDTMTPNTTPWEMLGFSEKPIWWEGRYGPGPYTSDNLVLWGDLEQGLVADPVAPYIRPNFARPGLTSVIPVDSLGQLLPPIQSVVGLYNPNDFRKSWAVGDGGPVEASWWMSSSYPFAVMRLLALTRPAQFFSLFADRDLYKYSEEFGQYLYNKRYRLDGNGVQVYGNGVSKASYINWIVDYNQQSGLNSTDALTTDLANLDVRLCYRMAAWSNEQYLEIYLEKSSPESQNKSLRIPPESYNLLVYKDQPFGQIAYSSVVVEKVDTGWAVYGYSNSSPYFPIVVSAANGKLQTVSAGGATVQVPAQYTSNVVNIPYGYVFINRAMMVDFLLSYGQYLQSQGLKFTLIENGYTLDWPQMAQEFLYFSQQGWQTGTLINLNPAAGQLEASQVGAVVDNIYSYSPENMLLDQNRQTFATRNLIIQRNGDSFKINPEPTVGQAISFLNLRFTDYEHIIVFDNETIFNDLIYEPITGARQNRLYLNAFNSTDWNGTLDAQGFILNNNNVKPWQSNLRYTKGEIVRYKNNFWQAVALVQPKTQFDYNDWLKSNYDRIQQGLLPNLANKADQLANTYNTQTANLNSANDLLAYNLIGFTPRQYMVDLNLDDVSQVNLYQQFIKTKGSKRATDLFTRVNLAKESGQYQIYENWGVLIGAYGANANRSYFEINLNEANLTSNPSTVQIIQPGVTSQANQTILLSNLWRESYRITDTDILPTIYPTMLDTALPSAGYVNLDDVDITVYSLDDPASISANINIIGTGTTIWVARDNSYSWNVYRCTPVPGQLTQITDNLNGTAVARFTQVSGLTFGDLVIVRYFASGVDGVYRVLSVPSPTTVVIAYSFTSTNQTTLTGTGLAWSLQTMRVAQASDVVDLPYASQLIPGARAWVDNNGSGHWEVIEKQQPFQTVQSLSATIPQSNSLYGASVAQTTNHFSLLTGSPAANSGVGAVYTARRIASSTSSGTYIPNTVITLSANGVSGFGNTVSWGDNNWAVVGADASGAGRGYATMLYQIPATNNYEITQLLTAGLNGNVVNSNAVSFGSATSISQDERWMYVGAADGNLVYTYGRVDVPEQTIAFTADGTTQSYTYNTAIQINYQKPDQLSVSVNNVLFNNPANYTINATQIIFNTPPPPGVTIIAARTTVTEFTSDGATDDYDLEPYLYIATNIDSLRIDVDKVLQRPYIDYTFAPGGTTVHFLIVPGNGTTITVQTQTYWQSAGVLDTSMLSPALPGDARFGTSISTSTDGRTILVGATMADTASVNNAGSVYAYDRSVIKYIVTDATQTTYAMPGASTAPIAVLLNGVFLTNTAQYVNGQFTISGSNIVLSSLVELVVGDNLEIETNQFQFVQTITAQAPEETSKFGQAVAICSNNCSLYIGAPQDSTVLTQAGSVERQVNQSRVYGVTSSLVANPTLTAGDTIRINDIEVAVPYAPTEQLLARLALAISPVAWTSTQQYYLNDRVMYNSLCYIALSTSIGSAQSPTNTSYWAQSFVIPNVNASLSSNLTFAGNGTTKIFFIGSVYTYPGSTPLVYLNNVLQIQNTDYTYNNASQQILFVTAPLNTTVVLVVTGKLILSVINVDAATSFNKLTVLPGMITVYYGAPSLFETLQFETFAYTQSLFSPNPNLYGLFGSAISVNNTSTNLVVGSPNGNVYQAMPFDGGETIFDDRSTIFNNPIANSGVAYTFDYLPSANETVSNPGKFVFGQQIYGNNLVPGDTFGYAVDYVYGTLIVGVPGADLGGSDNPNYGSTTVFENTNDVPAWTVLHEQQASVNIGLINSVYSFDKLLSSTQTYYDFFDPLQGTVLGVARRNIDYTGAVDPANYNTGTIHNNGNSWASDHVGEIWWDTDTVRFIDPNQDDIVYASRRWGQIFPGSRVDIYQWIESDQPPISYAGIGIPLSTTSYTVTSALTVNGIFATYYYFWVRGITTVASAQGKTLSTTAVASYIASPITSGIPYVAPLNASTVAIYNGKGFISASDTILHVEYDQQTAGSTANIHTEYEFVADGRADSFVNDSIYQKLQDSFCGVDVSGAQIPDPFLSPGMRYGVQFRPRQSMFVNRFTALENYLKRTNTIIAQYPITEIRSFNLLNSNEPIPAATTATATLASVAGNVLTVAGTVTGVFAVGQTVTGTGIPSSVTILALGTGTGGAGTYTISTSLTISAVLITGTTGYNATVATLEILSYQNLSAVNLGYLYLVLSDSSQNGRWTVYQVVTDGTQRSTQLVRIQNYDTRNYWSYVNWFRPGYNSTIQPIAQVTNTAALQTLSLTTAPIGSSVRVTDNGQGKFEIYLRTVTGWDRVGLQDGTIQFDQDLWDYAAGPYGFDAEVFDAQYFDQEPVIETRKIIQAINQELFIDDLLIYRNQLLILMFKFIYTEFSAPSWLTLSSFIDVDHRLRGLQPYQLYQKDNQTFVEDYLQEVKPFHVQTLAFNLIYDGLDTYPGNLSDFDVPAYWDVELEVPQFVSPVLTPYTESLSLGETFVSDADSNAPVWGRQPWQQWFNNHTLSVNSITVLQGGTGYTSTPDVIIGMPWIATTTYSVGQQIYHINTGVNNLYTVTAAGTTGTDAPVFTLGSQLNGSATLTWSGTGASATAIVNLLTGTISGITVTNTGIGYITTPDVTLIGGGGALPAGYAVVPVMGNQLVRDFTVTLKFDRCEYVTTIFEWIPGESYVTGNRVRWNNTVWQAAENTNATVFDPNMWTVVLAENLNGADRTMGYYVPTPNMPGLSLPLLIPGTSYPGVMVTAPAFNQNPGFDVGNFDINPFDNITYGPEGFPTFSPIILDAVYSSAYVDPYLGLRATDINVDGGGYIDVFSSYAPEELVPGSEFDTMDFRIYNRPVTNYTANGAQVAFAAPTGATTVVVCVNNVIIAGTNYSYVAPTVTFNTPPAAGDIVVIIETAPAIPVVDSRIFQTMRNIQLNYSITQSGTTELTQPLAADDDEIFVDNASVLSAPNFELNQWGELTINAERIMYREIDYVANTVSGLLRGTVGTAVAAHETAAIVYNISRNMLFPEAYQNYIVSTSTLANGTATVFNAPNITISTSTTTWATTQVVTGVNITNLLFACSCTASSKLLIVGNPVVVSGTNSGTSTIVDYTNPTTYQISATNGSTQFTLVTPGNVSIDTTAGTTTGLTFTVGLAYYQGAVVVNSGSYYMALKDVPYYTAITNTEYWQPLSRAVQVYVGGILLSDDYYTVTAQAPVSVTLDSAPADGVDVTILVRRIEIPSS